MGAAERVHVADTMGRFFVAVVMREVEANPLPDIATITEHPHGSPEQTLAVELFRERLAFHQGLLRVLSAVTDKVMTELVTK